MQQRSAAFRRAARRSLLTLKIRDLTEDTAGDFHPLEYRLRILTSKCKILLFRYEEADGKALRSITGAQIKSGA